MKKNNSKWVHVYLCSLFTLLFFSCVDPISPEFIYKDGLVIIEGLATSTPGTSYVSIKKTNSEFNLYRSEFQTAAIVSLNQIDTGKRIYFEEQDGIYTAPQNFAVQAGEIWELNIELQNGTKYQSNVEKVTEAVSDFEIKATYSNELVYRDDSNKFIPGHEISTSFKDSDDRKNYYLWRYRSYEKERYCAICSGGNFRDGGCKPDTSGFVRPPYFNYYCEGYCWKIRYNETVEIYDDVFSNGSEIESLAIGNVLLYTNYNILIKVEKLSLSYDAYQYFKKLKDLVDNNGNLDAPPPAAIIGNIFNPDNPDEIVLGRFNVSSSNEASLFIKRDHITDQQLERIIEPILEGDPPFKPNITTAACKESRTRTSLRPNGWVGN